MEREAKTYDRVMIIRRHLSEEANQIRNEIVALEKSYNNLLNEIASLQCLEEDLKEQAKCHNPLNVKYVRNEKL